MYFDELIDENGVYFVVDVVLNEYVRFGYLRFRFDFVLVLVNVVDVFCCV